ncbi:MAG: zinc-binding dehydrogenase, partial [Thiomonas sp.]
MQIGFAPMLLPVALGVAAAWVLMGLAGFVYPRSVRWVARVIFPLGAVGSVVGQLAKAKGCRVVGVAGGAQKCRYVVEELGFDACVDYKAGNLKADLKAALPGGVDALFENVGGDIFDTLLTRTNA